MLLYVSCSLRSLDWLRSLEISARGSYPPQAPQVSSQNRLAEPFDFAQGRLWATNRSEGPRILGTSYFAAMASKRLRKLTFFSAGRKEASKEFLASSRRCSSVKANFSCASWYS